MEIRPVGSEGITSFKGLKASENDNIERDNAPSFKETISKVIDEVNVLQNKADESIENFTTGKVEDIHEVIIAMEKADMSFRFLMETRNKLVEAYKEVSRMAM